MADYKVYNLDDAGRISSAGEWLEAKSDDEALALVCARKPESGCEVCSGKRLVARVSPRS